MRDINLIVIHCSATTPNQDIGRAEIDLWHRDRGWAGIGYHYVIRRDGQVETGRPESQVGSHVQGRNRDSLGVCLVGGVRREGDRLVAEANFTQAQWDALKRLVQDLHAKYPDAEIKGHRDFANKACPSFSVRDWLVRENVLPTGLTFTSEPTPAPKPLTQSSTVRGAVVTGAVGVAGVAAENIDTITQAATASASFTEPGTILSMLVVLLIIVGTVYTILGRKRVRDEEGV